MLKNNGEISIYNANSSNIPMNCFIEFNESDELWEWSAGNFCPRKGTFTDNVYLLTSHSKEEIEHVIKKIVAPLYEVAFTNITTKCNNYYWE